MWKVPPSPDDSLRLTSLRREAWVVTAAVAVLVVTVVLYGLLVLAGSWALRLD